MGNSKAYLCSLYGFCGVGTLQARSSILARNGCDKRQVGRYCGLDCAKKKGCKRMLTAFDLDHESAA